MSLEEADGKGKWTREEDDAFETALADALPWKSEEEDEGDMRRWEELVGKVGTKTIEEIRKHYEMLVDDISAIEAGKVEVPNYVGEEEVEKEKGGESVDGGGGKSGLSKAEQERRKGIPWTEEEHKLFLLGLSKFGKGDWRSISRNYVISRTPTQVASHAQKYFIRLNSMNRDRRRSSIHDITSVNNGDVLSSPQTSSIGSSTKHPPPQPQVNMHGVGVYGVNHHMVSAVGTPVMLPSGQPGHPHSHPHPHPHHHPPYVVPMAYPIQPPPAMHQ